MKKLFLVFLVFLFSGCAARVPYKDLNLDTTSNFKIPTPGKSGIYVYQWKTGILGAAMDVSFEVKGLPEVFLNTGEYCYFEVDPGEYKYEFSGGIFKQYLPVEFQGDQNYFFRAFILNFSDSAILQREQIEIDETKKNILSERYELCSKD